MVAWLDMIDAQAADTLLDLLQRDYKGDETITYSSYLCTSPPPSYVFTQCPRVADITQPAQPSTSSKPDPSFAEDEHDVGLTLSTCWREQR